MLNYQLKDKLKEHIKKEHSAELGDIIDDFYSYELCNKGNYKEFPLYHIKMLCLLKKEDSYSLVLYRAETTEKYDDKVAYESIDPIIENFTYSFYTYSRGTISFIKDGIINSYDEIFNRKDTLEFEGKACPIDDDYFYIINGNTLNKAWVSFADRKFELCQKKLYEDKKEISYATELDMGKGHFEDFWCSFPDLEATLISFADGTKRLLIGYYSKKGKDNYKTSKYFDNLEYLKAYITMDEDKYEEAPVYNTDKEVWHNYEKEFDKDSIHYNKYAYFVPGLTFKYTLGNFNGIYIIKNNGNQKIVSKKRINNSENK